MKAIIFDLDGTLYDNSNLPLRLILHCLTSVFTLKAERTARAQFSGQYFGNSEEYFKMLFKRMSAISGKSTGYVERWYHGKYMPTMCKVLEKHYHYKDGVPEKLARLREQGIKSAVFSDYDHIIERLRALDINPEWFDVCIDAPAAGGLKPCRESFLNIAEMLDCEPNDILVIGDRDDTDGQGARNSGMQFLLVKKKAPFLHDIQKLMM